jgi:hypothetical protein
MGFEVSSACERRKPVGQTGKLRQLAFFFRHDEVFFYHKPFRYARLFLCKMNFIFAHLVLIILSYVGMRTQTGAFFFPVSFSKFLLICRVCVYLKCIIK